MGKTKLSGGFYILIAACLLLLPLQWVLAALLAGFFHELCHWAAICLLSRESASVSLCAYGARMALPAMSRSKELLCALAGPAGSLLLLLFARWLPRTAICAAVQALYNLLPVYPLDGGRAVQCTLSMLLPPPKAAHLCRRIEQLCLFALMLLSIYTAFFLELGILPFILAGTMFLRLKIVKMPCKVALQRVQ